MRKLSKYLKPHLLFVILAPLLMLVEVSSELFIPKLMSKIVNIGIANNDTQYILTTGAVMLLTALLGIIGGIGCTVCASIAGINFGSDVRKALFEKIQRFSFANLDKYHTSSLITRLTNDITQVQQVVMMCLRMLVRSPLTFLGGIIMAYSLNPSLTSILFVAVVFLIFTITIVMSLSFPLFKVVQAKIDKVNTVMRENLSGIRVIKAFVREDLEKEKFDEASTDLRATTIKAFRIMTLIMPIMMFTMNLVTIFVIWFGGKQVNTGTMLAGDLMAYVTYLTQILMSLMMVGMALMMVSRGKVSAERINSVLDTKFDIINPTTPVENAITKGDITFEHVTFRYPLSTGDPVLKDINLSIKAGQTIGILGETGAGKSTFVNLIPRLYDVTSGSVKIDGVDVRDMTLEYLRNSIGIVLQKAILFSGTIRDNIKWGKADATDEEIYQAAKNAQAYDFIMSLPDKFDTVLGQAGINLSGGQKQRISIARTLISKPKILILDDSTSAVDITTEAKIQKALKEELSDTTKIIITQKISSVKNADEIIVINSGEIVAFGTHTELINTSKIYNDIYKSQILEEGEDNE